MSVNRSARSGGIIGIYFQRCATAGIGNYSRASMARILLEPQNMFETGVVRANDC